MGPARPLRDRTIVSVPIKMRNQILIRSGVCGDVEGGDQDPVVRGHFSLHHGGSRVAR